MSEQMPGRARAVWERVSSLGQQIMDAVFYPAKNRLAGGFSWLLLVGLLLFGAYLWGIFYSWGNISMDFLDWAEVTGPRIALLQDAVRQGVLPLHAANLTALRGVTDRYFAIPDTPFSPEVLLLRWLDIGRYLFAGTLLLYGLGFAGLVLLYRKYRLSPFVFLILFLLVNFNGDITGHLAVGHSIYTGYFLIPFFIYLVLGLLERERVGWKWQLGMALLLLLVLAQGLFHLYIWCLMFLGLLALLNLRLLKPVLISAVFAVLVGLPRLLPPALVVQRITHEFMGGFATVTDLFISLAVLKDPDRAVMLPSKIYPLSWWELDYFIGLLGLAFVLLFGVAAPLWRDRLRKTPILQLLLVSLIFTALSIGQVFGVVLDIFPVPPFTAERVTSRMFAVPLVALLVIAAIYLQAELNRLRPRAGMQLALLGLAGLLYHDLYQHLQAWRIRYLDGLVYLFPKVPFDAAQHTIQNHADAPYTNLLAGGALVMLLALAFLAVMAARERRKAAG